MATFTKTTGGKVRVQIRRTGLPSIAKTCDDMTEAKKWATKTEADLDAGKKAGVYGKTGMTFGEAVEQYMNEKKALSKTAVCILGNLKEKLGKIRLDKLTDEDIVAYIRNKKFGSPMTGSMHFSFFSTVLKEAKIEWKHHVPDVLPEAKARLKRAGLVGDSKERKRLPTLEEIELLCNYNWPTSIPMADIIRFAIASAMRQAEITRIEYRTLVVAKATDKQSTIMIKDRKHPKIKIGNDQIVPILPEALEIINRQVRKEGDERIFPYAAATICTYFSMACKNLKIDDLHFHDLRHEAATRLFKKGYSIPQVALFTGHADWAMLKRYTHLKAEDLPTMKAPTPVAELPSIVVPTKTSQASNTVAVDMKEFQAFMQFKKMQEMIEAMKPTETA